MSGDEILNKVSAIPRNEILSEDTLLATIKEGKWINDEALTKQLLFELTSFLITLDTRTEEGNDFKIFNNFCKKLLASFDIPFFEFGTKNKAIIISPDRSKLENLRSNASFNINKQIGFEYFFYTHIDVVDFKDHLGKNIPYTSNREDVYGRGANDMKGQVASVLAWLIREKIEGRLDHLDLCLMIGVDEETGSEEGSRVINRVKANHVLDFEPTANISGVFSDLTLRYFDLQFETKKIISAKDILNARLSLSELTQIPVRDIRMISKVTPLVNYVTIAFAGMNRPLDLLLFEDYLEKNLFARQIKANPICREWKSSASEESKAALSRALQNHFEEIIVYPGEDNLVTAFYPNGTPRSIALAPFFRTATQYNNFGGNSMIYSFPENGKAGGNSRHSDMEGGHIDDYYRFFRTIFDFITFTSEP